MERNQHILKLIEDDRIYLAIQDVIGKATDRYISGLPSYRYNPVNAYSPTLLGKCTKMAKTCLAIIA